MMDANFRWTEDEICDYYDSHPNVTIQEIAELSGWSTTYVKRVLMGDDWND